MGIYFPETLAYGLEHFDVLWHLDMRISIKFPHVLIGHISIDDIIIHFQLGL